MYSLIGLDKVYEITIEIKAPKKEIMEERNPFEVAEMDPDPQHRSPHIHLRRAKQQRLCMAAVGTVLHQRRQALLLLPPDAQQQALQPCRHFYDHRAGDEHSKPSGEHRIF